MQYDVRSLLAPANRDATYLHPIPSAQLTVAKAIDCTSSNPLYVVPIPVSVLIHDVIVIKVHSCDLRKGHGMMIE